MPTRPILWPLQRLPKPSPTWAVKPKRPIGLVIWPLRLKQRSTVALNLRSPSFAPQVFPPSPTTNIGRFIWPLRARLFNAIFYQQRPIWTGGLAIPNLVINRPWNVVGAPGFKDRIHTKTPSIVHQLLPKPPTYFRITGTTKDSTGVALGNCVVDWFDTVTDTKLGTVTSDASGLFEFRTAGQPPNAYYLVAYKAGSPDVAGTTVSTLTGI